ncbi:YetF domain-containing protein [Paenibacillus terreus]|uniref:YetF domain-containing protein n=1 Tax=Paenibacillus terreus TaxID=1387834 RepID=A0ABV5BD53_9BACL
MDQVGMHIFRTVLMYVVLYVIMRIMGKREIGKLSLFDLIISIMMAEIAVFSLEDIQRPLYNAFVPLATLLILQISIAYIGLKNRGIRLLFDGKPAVIIAGGELDREMMAKQRYNLDDLMLQLREQNIASISDVDYAILETSGKLAVIPKINGYGDTDSSQGAARSSDGRGGSSPIRKELEKFKYEGLPVPLIMDGKVQDANLEKINKTRFWLKNQIQLQGHNDFKDIFLCTLDHNGKLYVSAGNKRE